MEELTRTQGWAMLEKLAGEKLEAIKDALCKVDPTNAGQIASLQAQARECRYFFGIVAERIRKGREAAERLRREEERSNGRTIR